MTRRLSRGRAAAPVSPRTNKRLPRPFLKWVGGKTQLLAELRRAMPPEYGAYHEPFVGGGALFFELHHNHRAHLSDINAELINCYKVIKRDPDALIEHLESYRYDEETYYETRALDPDELPNDVERAARTIYLNKTGYNGLFRVNSQGQFNVPFGRYKNPTICDEENLRAVSRALKKATPRCESFDKVIKRAKEGDFVYFDPPYFPLSQTAHFTAYVKSGFDVEQQERLAALMRELTENGVYVLLSNSDHPRIRKLYQQPGFIIETVQAKRSVNSRASRRGKINELLIRNYKETNGKAGENGRG